MPEESKSKKIYFMPHINYCIISGNVSTDMDIRYIPNGQAVCNFTLMSNRRYKKDDQWIDATPTSIRIVCWGKLAERIGEATKRGDGVVVKGRLDTNEWESPDGQKKSRTEITADSIQRIGYNLSDKTEDEKSEQGEIPDR